MFIRYYMYSGWQNKSIKLWVNTDVKGCYRVRHILRSKHLPLLLVSLENGQANVCSMLFSYFIWPGREQRSRWLTSAMKQNNLYCLQVRCVYNIRVLLNNALHCIPHNAFHITPHIKVTSFFPVPQTYYILHAVLSDSCPEVVPLLLLLVIDVQT
jgi:hypothetical protein